MKDLIEINSRILKKAGIAAELELEENLPLLMVDGNKIMQVMVNVFNNSVDATKGNGMIIIKTGSVETGHGGKAVYFSISDTGKGISPENMEKIFEPFFTTKPPGEGTGLGLPVSQAIIQKLGGKLELTSTLGAGTSVKVILPLA